MKNIFLHHSGMHIVLFIIIIQGGLCLMLTLDYIKFLRPELHDSKQFI